MGNLIWEKTQLEGVDYALLSFPWLMNASTKKGALSMEFSWILWIEWLLQNLLPPLSCFNNPLLNVFLNYATITLLKELNPFSLYWPSI